MARPKQNNANIAHLRELYNIMGNVVDYLPIVAYTMRECGCTYSEIAEVFDIKRQQAEYFVNNIRKALGQL